jgi:hypothetical protein
MKITLVLIMTLLLNSNVHAKKKKPKKTYIKGSVERFYDQGGYRQNAYGVKVGMNFMPVKNQSNDSISVKKSNQLNESDQ